MATIVKDNWPPVSLIGTTVKRYPSGNKMNGNTGNHVQPTACVSGYVNTTPSKGKVPSWYPSTVREWSFDSKSNDPFAGLYAQNKWNTTSADNKSWAELIDSVRSGPASLGVAFAEWGESFTMIANRAIGLSRAADALRKGKFRYFLRELRVKPLRKHRNWVRNRADEASGLWLEYSFGWKPFTQDIYDGCQVLAKPLPGGRAYGRGKQDFTYQYSQGSAGLQLYATGYHRVQQGGEFYVTNPNEYLLQQLGLHNPLTIAWEIVPFSFVVDWAFDVGSFLGGFTDMAGLTIVNPYYSRTTRYRNLVSMRYNWGGHDETMGPLVQKGTVFVRKTTLIKPKPNFNVLANVGQSWRRAANAVSLLVQILNKM